MRYNFILKALGDYNKASGQQPLTIQRRREIVSTILYPKYKDQRYFKTAVRQEVKGIVQELPPAEVCNPLYLDEAYLTLVEFFNIDEHIRTVLPDCIDVKVSGGGFGQTKIFNTQNYTYHASGVKKIVEEIRDYIGNSSDIAFFTGIIKLKPKKKNNGRGENYYVDYVLYINNVAQANDKDVNFDKATREQTKVNEIQKFLGKKIKRLKAEKRKRKNQAIKVAKKAEAAKPKSQAQREAEIKTAIKQGLESLKNLYLLGALTREQYNQQKKALLNKKP